jgi:hypothetical protein
VSLEVKEAQDLAARGSKRIDAQQHQGSTFDDVFNRVPGTLGGTDEESPSTAAANDEGGTGAATPAAYHRAAGLTAEAAVPVSLGDVRDIAPRGRSHGSGGDQSDLGRRDAPPSPPAIRDRPAVAANVGQVGENEDDVLAPLPSSSEMQHRSGGGQKPQWRLGPVNMMLDKNAQTNLSDR